jgi:hypothetical protein
MGVTHGFAQRYFTFYVDRVASPAGGATLSTLPQAKSG